MALADLNVRIGADTTGLDRGLKTVKYGLASLVKTGLALGGTVFGLKALENAFVGLQSSVARTNSLFGDSAKYIKYFAENTGKAFGMAESSAYQYAATYGNLFKNITQDQVENSKVTIAMLKASAVVASKTGRTMEDVMDRIRSGLLGSTEAIEDLGINVNVAMLESTDAFKKIANGRSWEKLTFYEQQQIRTLGILEQAHKNFGDEVQQGSAFSLSVLSGAFKDLTATAGMFLDAGLQPIIRGLIVLVQGATAGLKALAALFGLKVIDTSGTEAQTDAQDDLTDAIDDTTKATKKSVAGFDEVNTLAEKSEAIGADAGAVDNSPFAGITTPEFEETVIDTGWIDDLKSKFNALRASAPFMAIADSAKTAWARIASAGLELSRTFNDIWSGLQDTGLFFVNWLNRDFVAYLQTWIRSCGNAVSGLLGVYGTVFKDVWNTVLIPFVKSLGLDLLPMLTQFATRLVDAFDLAFSEMKRIFDVVWTQGIVPALGEITQIWTEFISLLKSKWDAYGVPIFSAIRDAIKKTADTLLNIWNTVLKPVWDRIMETVDWLWTKHLKPLVDRVLEFAATFIRAALDIYNQFILPIVNWFVTVLGPGVSSAVSFVIDVIGTIVATVTDVVSGVIEIFEGLIDFIAGVFTGDWERAWEGVKKIFKGVFDGLWAIIKVPLNLIIDGVNWLIRGMNKISFKVPDWVSLLFPGIGGKTWGVNIPEITKLATGGIIDSPTIAMLGERGREAVIPLENTAFVDTLASAVGTAVLAAMQAASVGRSTEDPGRPPIIEVDGVKLARVLLPKMRSEMERNPAVLRTVGV